jgi:Ni/Co efflux regulator RcnB
MAKFSMHTRLICAAGAIVLMTAIPVAHPASAQGLNDIVRNLNNTINPSDAQRREDQARREDQLRREDRAHRREGWSEQEQYGRGHRRTSESREYNRDGGDRGDYGDRRDSDQQR